MEIDLVWLLLLPVIFALGWMTARYDRIQFRRESRQIPKEILRAMSALVAERPREATEALLAAAHLAPDSTDLHQTVGNLYRRQGLIDRAMEVHEAALGHPNLSFMDRAAIVLDLARDYVAAGLFDRAEAALTDLIEQLKTRSDADAAALANVARLLMLEIWQRVQNWDAAIFWAHEAQAHGARFDPHGVAQLLGHFYCEKAMLGLSAGDASVARDALAKAAAVPSVPPGVVARMQWIESQLHDRAQAGQAAGGVASGAAGNASAAEWKACTVCGFRTKQMMWRCPGCHHWDSFLTTR